MYTQKHADAQTVTMLQRTQYRSKVMHVHQVCRCPAPYPLGDLVAVQTYANQIV